MDDLEGPKSNDKCPYKRQKRSRVETEAEIGAMWPQAKECLEPSEAGRGRKDPPLEP